VDAEFSLANTLGDPLKIREWNTMGLPADQFSTENAILVTRSRRWSLMIDPQSQANRWLKAQGASSGLQVCLAELFVAVLGARDDCSLAQVLQASQPGFLRTLENAIRYGQVRHHEGSASSLTASAAQSVLLEDVTETLDASIEPVLAQQVFKKGGQSFIRLGDQASRHWLG
jgi:dynein heavy chain